MFHVRKFKYSPSNKNLSLVVLFYHDACTICLLTFIFRLILYNIEMNMNDDTVTKCTCV